MSPCANDLPTGPLSRMSIDRVGARRLCSGDLHQPPWIATSMTSSAPVHAPVQPHDPEARLRDALASSGQRFTEQRAAVYRHLCAVETHPTADDVFTAATLRKVKDVGQALAAIPGVAELGDLTRFDTPRQLAAFVGLTPSEHSSGDTRRQGGITKAGNGRARRARAAGASDFISKSAEATDVLSRIGELLKGVSPGAAQALAQAAAPQPPVAAPASQADTTRDPLTGVLTSPALLNEGRKHFSYSQRHGSPLSIMAFRVDSYAQTVREVVYSILSNDQRQRLETDWQIDLAYSIPGKARFRVNCYYQRASIGAAFAISFDTVSHALAFSLTGATMAGALSAAACSPPYMPAREPPSPPVAAPGVERGAVELRPLVER